MKVLIWNGRRIGKVEKQREAKDYIRAQEADLIGLVETKVKSGKLLFLLKYPSSCGSFFMTSFSLTVKFEFSWLVVATVALVLNAKISIICWLIVN